MRQGEGLPAAPGGPRRGRASTAITRGDGEIDRARDRGPSPATRPTTALTTVLGVGSTPPLMSLLLVSLRLSSRALAAPGPFLRFSLARIDDSRSGNGGISSSTVACGQEKSQGALTTPEGAPKACGMGSDQNISAGYRAEGEVLHCPLLELHIGIAQLGPGTQNALDGGLGLGEEVDELDVGGQEQGAGGHAAQVELGVQQ